MALAGYEFLDRINKAILECRVTLQSQWEPPLPLSLGMDRMTSFLRQIKADQQKVILIGNGGSAAIASHQAVDLCRNAGISALTFNDPSLITCLANDFGYEHVFEKAISIHAEPGDLLIAISSSGASPNILNGVTEARRQLCKIVSFSGFDPENSLGKMGDLNFFVNSSSYGVVETAHLIIVHSVVDQFFHATRKGAHESRRTYMPLPKAASDPTN